MSRPPLEVADLVRAAGTAFLERSRQWIRWPHLKVLLALERRRTAALGGHIDECTRCGRRATISYSSCRNRHCPKCQTGARGRWLQARRRELLPCPCVHVVFTLPAQLVPLALHNNKLIYEANTLLEVAHTPRHLGAEIGFFSVLHTWNRKLQLHPHAHCVVAAGQLLRPLRRGEAQDRRVSGPELGDVFCDLSGHRKRRAPSWIVSKVVILLRHMSQKPV